MPAHKRTIMRLLGLSAVAWGLLASSNASADEAQGFHFGSYGRVRAATDLHGGTGQDANFVGHGSRLDESPYLELELRRTDWPEKGKLRVRVVSTLAIAGDPFHYNGQWFAATALRNMFVDVKGIGLPGLTVWAGARMYRGDDMYLLDFWPLDNLNTVGAGAFLDVGSGTRIQLHGGTNRILGDKYAFQARPVPSRSHYGWDTAVTLDRPRTITSAKITQFFNGFTAPNGFKASLYGEGHFLPSGKYSPEPTNQVRPSQNLPADTGFVIGAQGTAYGFGERAGHVHMFARYARGIAAYGDLATPTTLDQGKRAKASELLLATSGNYELGRFSVMAAGYARLFDDGSGGEYSNDHFWEGIFVARPTVYLTEHTGIATELSYQVKNRKVLDDAGRHRVPKAFRLSLLPLLTPYGWGSYKRPMIYGVYTMTFRNDAAKGLYPKEDPRSNRTTEHYLGVQAEWWFNSSSYP